MRRRLLAQQLCVVDCTTTTLFCLIGVGYHVEFTIANKVLLQVSIFTQITLVVSMHTGKYAIT